MIAVPIIPEYRVANVLALHMFFRFVARRELPAGDLDEYQPLFRKLIFPPDQVVSERDAILSEVELQPDHAVFQL